MMRRCVIKCTVKLLYIRAPDRKSGCPIFGHLGRGDLPQVLGHEWVGPLVTDLAQSMLRTRASRAASWEGARRAGPWRALCARPS